MTLLILNATECPICGGTINLERNPAGTIVEQSCKNSNSLEKHSWSIRTIPDGTVNYVEFYHINGIFVSNFVGLSKESHVVLDTSSDDSKIVYSEEDCLCPIVHSLEEYENYRVLK